MSGLFYGATSRQNIEEAIRIACQALSPSTAHNAIPLLGGTFSAETGLGTVIDRHEAQGKGLAQFDSIRFFDVKNYVQNRNERVKDVFELYGFSWFSFDQLDYSPLLSAFCCRVGYMMKPEPLPDGHDLQAQGEYWKKHWNSAAGKGSPEHYIAMTKKHWLGE